MLIKLKVPVKVGVKYFLVDPTAPQGTAHKSVTLLSFRVDKGRLEWDMVTSDNHRLAGTLRAPQRLPFFPGAWVTPSIPLTLHDKQSEGLAMDMIFNVPSHFRVDYRV